MADAIHQAVLFDLFDTLCHVDEAGYIAAKNEEARFLGVDPERFFAAWLAAGDRAQTGVLPDVEARVRDAAAASGVMIDARAARAVARMEEESLMRRTRLHPDVLPTLEALRRRPALRIGLVSNASSTAALLFERLGLAPYFDQAVFSFRVGLLKPDPGIYLHACARLGVGPGACLFVGDGNGRELDGAMAVGMEAVRIERAIVPGPYRKGESERFDASVDDLTRVVALIRS